MSTTSLCVVSDNERRFILDGVLANFRSDGRSRTELRPLELETGVISNANGSARLRLWGTEVLVGVKAEVAEPKAEAPALGLLEPTVICASSAARAFEGRRGEMYSRWLTQAMQHVADCRDVIKLEDLCIIEGQRVWALKVDALVLQGAGGSLLDAVSLATLAALRTTQIPNWTLVKDADGNAADFELSDDPYDLRSVDCTGFPLYVSLNALAFHPVVDASAAEEACADAAVHFAIDAEGRICCTLQRSFSTGLHPALISEMAATAQTIAVQQRENLETALKAEAAAQRNKVAFFA